MSYTSPLHIVAGLADDPAMALTADNLVRLRKRLLAELNLSGESSITVHGKAYTKDAIIKTIDQLLQSERLELHDFIYRHTFLLNYLEDESSLIEVGYYAGLVIPESIRQALGLLLSERAILQFKKGISSRKFAIAERALVLMNLLESNLRLACYEEVHRSLTAFYHFLWELKKSISRHSENEIGFLSYESLAVFLNALPDSFSEVKRSIISCCISIVVVYDSFSEHNHALVLSISTMLLQLECEEEQSELIRRNHATFSAFQQSSALWTPNSGPSKTAEKTKPATSNLDYRSFLWLILAIVIVSILGNLANPEESFDEESISSVPQVPAMEESRAAKTISDFRMEVLKQISTGPENNLTYFTDPVHPFPGLSPFKDPKFYSDSTGFKDWTNSLRLGNQTAYDLIVFRFDSLHAELNTVFIPQNTSVSLKFGNTTRFLFYFGNVLMTRKSIVLNGSPEQELFTKLHEHSDEILFKDYRIILPPSADPAKEISLDLKPDFLDDPKDAYSFNGFRLVVSHNGSPGQSAEVMPEFPGGVDAIERYIQNTLRYPESAISRDISGRVLIRFIVNAQGKVSGASVIGGIPNCPECDEEALRVIKAMPEWTPGMQDGKAVPVLFTIPIHFKIY